MGAFKRHAFFTWALLVFATTTSAVPQFGIEKDVPPSTTVPEGVNSRWFSFSAIVEFTGDKDPGDECDVTDGQFVNLAALAFDEMKAKCKQLDIGDDDCPDAMGALQFGKRMYFASSIKDNWHRLAVSGIHGDEVVPGSVGKYMLDCLFSFNDGETLEHRTQGRCAEPNIVRLAHEHLPAIAGEGGVMTRPGLSPNRFTVWGMGGPKGNKTPMVFEPCKKNPAAYRPWQGCRETFMPQFGLQPIKHNTPRDREGEDGFGFKKVDNKRFADRAPGDMDWDSDSSMEGQNGAT